MSTYQLLRLSWRALQPAARLPGAGETRGPGALRAPRALGSAAVRLDDASFAETAEAVASLQRRGRIPAVVLHGAELPAELAEAGWADRGVAEAFAGYAREVVSRLQAVTLAPVLWVTLEDPWQIAFGAHQRPDPAATLAAAHHLNLGHGLAAMAIREVAAGDQVGLALRLHVPRAADPERAADLEAAHRVALLGNHVFLGPVMDGSYPVELRRRTRGSSDWGFVQPGDLVAMRQHLDHLVAVSRSPVSVREVPTVSGGPAGWFDLDDVEMVVEQHASERADAYYDLLTALDNAYDGHPMLALAGPEARDPAVRTALIAAAERARADGAAVTGHVLEEGSL